MQGESRTRTFFMVLGLAAFVGIGAACFTLMGNDSDSKGKPGATASCDGLEGQAKTDCEARRQR